MTDRPVTEMSFEDAMAELEKVVEELEQGRATLENSIKLYQRGAELKERCTTTLNEAEEKVAVITQDADGNAVGLKKVDDF
ncbi:exodeoxyribonuclease VII small subunit [Thalassobius vesicularis]|uniref:Exodeoxyribonuclease 7 small subunit n=1 Tax=Thalassobius vesicularis TaxID=1294297 RepID=A0A4S3M8K0_9RHOB|nr:exodeoxyribonuclease VII small subunit [Thalassobius vesicularis]THD73772.1 exodeoxyribonuclease VII small subunit [Thalassobius vesicularis]